MIRYGSCLEPRSAFQADQAFTARAISVVCDDIEKM
jgi:hypothetical protein